MAARGGGAMDAGVAAAAQEGHVGAAVDSAWGGATRVTYAVSFFHEHIVWCVFFVWYGTMWCCWEYGEVL